MAKIVFIMDTEEGHIIPSFGLAHSLEERGHEIAYVSIIDNEQLVREQGFTFYPILEKSYPKGFREKIKVQHFAWMNKSLTGPDTLDGGHYEEFVNGYYDSLLKDIRADLFIINIFLSIETLLLYYKFNIRPVLLTPFLREEGKTAASDCLDSVMALDNDKICWLIEFLNNIGFSFTSFSKITEPLDTFCQLVLCPAELEMQRPSTNKSVQYIGPSIRKREGFQDSRALYRIPAHKKIIYASMGSQAIRHGALCDTFFGKMIRVMRHPELQDMHLILNTGSEYEQHKFKDVPANVTIAGWVSQLDILQAASVAVTHGGLGSVKECIYFGVPMIVFPLVYDQPLNAKRIVFHQLGLEGNIETVTDDALKSYILHVLNDQGIQNSVKRMQEIFRQREDARSGARIIEEVLKSRNTVLSEDAVR